MLTPNATLLYLESLFPFPSVTVQITKDRTTRQRERLMEPTCTSSICSTLTHHRRRLLSSPLLSSPLLSDLFSSPPLLQIYDLIVCAQRRRSEAVNSILGSQGMVLATTMAVSSTVILLAFRRQKPLSTTQFAVDQNSGSSPRILRSCISSDGKKRDKKKKRVHFATDVVDPMGNGEEFKKEHNKNSMMSNQICRSQSYRVQQTPSNRAALYNGILRDRVQPQRMGCS